MASGRRPFFKTFNRSKSPSIRLKYPQKPAEAKNASRNSGPNKNLLKCPICLQYPRKEVFICRNGHSVCHVCMLKMKNCPNCRVPYESDDVRPIRNYAMEALLDSLKVSCEWKDAGCQEKGFPRLNLIAHEAQCRYNPEAINFCTISRLSSECSYKTSPKAMLEDPHQAKQLMAHMSNHHDVIRSETITGETSSHGLLYWHFWSNSDSNQISYVFYLTDHITGRTLGVYMVFLKLDLGVHGRELSWNLVSLVGAPQQQQTVSASFYLLKNKRSKSVVNGLWGVESVPSMMWSQKPMELNKYQDFLSIPLDQRLENIFTMPVPHLEKYYVEEGTPAGLTWHITFQCTENAIQPDE